MTAHELGAQVSTRRQQLRLGQEELAELAGVSVRFVRDLEHGKITVRLDKVECILDALGLAMTVQVRGR
jgi:y4mF family transcriptional regulator